jgi:long-chain acyl-CoA synthetase
VNIAHLLTENIKTPGESRELIFLGSDTQTSLTYTQINERTAGLAGGLEALGVAKGDVVGTVLSNTPEILEIMNGVLRLGAIYLPIVYMLSADEMRYIIRDSGTRIIITQEQFVSKVNAAVEPFADQIRIIIIGGSKKDGRFYAYDNILAGSPKEVREMSEDDLAILMYTSGTTGSPKGVKLSHGNHAKNLLQGLGVWPHRKDDRFLIVLPMNHIYGIMCANEMCYSNCSLVLMDKFNALKTLEVIRDYNITIIAVVPTMITMMMELFDPEIHNVVSLRYMICAGAPLAEATLEKAREMFKVEIFHGYGCTEAGPTITRQRRKTPLKTGSVGPPLPGVELMILDQSGKPVPVGEEGEVVCKGPGIMKGYWNKPEETAKALKNGWLHTGDLGRLDQDRELYITGRIKDLIIKGGENIDPSISEKLLYRHPAIMEAAVIALPDTKYGEEVGAAVVLKPGHAVTEDELLAYLKDHVHHFTAPKKIFLMESMPMSSTGKLLKRELRKMAADIIAKEEAA